MAKILRVITVASIDRVEIGRGRAGHEVLRSFVPPYHTSHKITRTPLRTNFSSGVSPKQSGAHTAKPFVALELSFDERECSIDAPLSVLTFPPFAGQSRAASKLVPSECVSMHAQ